MWLLRRLTASPSASHRYGFGEDVVERDGLQIAGPDHVGQLVVDVRDRQVVEVTDHDGLRVEVLVGHLDDLALGYDVLVSKRARPHRRHRVAEVGGDAIDNGVVAAIWRPEVRPRVD